MVFPAAHHENKEVRPCIVIIMILLNRPRVLPNRSCGEISRANIGFWYGSFSGFVHKRTDANPPVSNRSQVAGFWNGA
jgi:hypothetical protein